MKVYTSTKYARSHGQNIMSVVFYQDICYTCTCMHVSNGRIMKYVTVHCRFLGFC